MQTNWVLKFFGGGQIASLQWDFLYFFQKNYHFLWINAILLVILVLLFLQPRKTKPWYVKPNFATIANSESFYRSSAFVVFIFQELPKIFSRILSKMPQISFSNLSLFSKDVLCFWIFFICLNQTLHADIL